MEGKGEVMVISFSKLLSGLSRTEKSNECHYNMAELGHELQINGSAEILVDDDCLILPFYICKEGRYEMYWFELLIRLVESPSFDNYVLTKTGHKNVAMVDKSIKDRMERLYIEILHPSVTLSSAKLLNYVNFIKDSEEVKKDVVDAFIGDFEHFEFDANKLYFAVY